MAGSPIVPGFEFADLERRVFLKPSRDGSYLHIVHAVDADDRRVQDGLITAGMLVCDGCKGGKYRANCHAVASAEALLRAAGQSAVAWIDTPNTTSMPSDLTSGEQP
jgi:hypothetical protein